MLAPSLPRAELVPVTDAETIRSEWSDLARRAIEPNPYYEPDHLIAVCGYMRPDEKHWLVLVRDRVSDRLDGLFPVTVKGFRDGFPGGVTYLSFDSLVGQTVPLVAGDDPASVWAAFIGFVAERAELPTITCLQEFYAESPCGQALAKAVSNQQAEYRTESSFARAVATNGMSYEDYLERWSRKKARNLRSRFKKLSELGAVELEILEPGDARFGETLEQILELEAAGWKGRAGTALVSQERTRNFVRDAYASGRNAPAVHLATLRLDGKLIAGDINLIAQRRAYFIKSAYDEAYSKYGPGVILYGFALEEMLDRGRYERLDSCADAGHPLEEIWLERERVERAFVAAPGPAGKRAINRLIAGRTAMFAMRDAMRGAKRLLGRSG
jgi:hypothetical protein